VTGAPIGHQPALRPRRVPGSLNSHFNHSVLYRCDQWYIVLRRQWQCCESVDPPWTSVRLYVDHMNSVLLATIQEWVGDDFPRPQPVTLTPDVWGRTCVPLQQTNPMKSICWIAHLMLFLERLHLCQGSIC